MKLFQKTLVAGLLAADIASVADAQTVIHITGSTAFRSSTVTAITHILKPGFTYGYAGASFTGANQQIFTGMTSNNIPVIIKTSWSGTLAGLQTVSQQLPVSTFLTNTTPQSTSGTANAPAVYDPPTVPEITMCDGVQANTPFPTPALTAQSVGAVCFKWIASPGTPLTNLTAMQAQALFEAGSLPLALFTGVPTDATNTIYAIGRDADSGTRKTALSETGIGSFSSIVQYFPTNAAGAVISRTAAGPIVGQELVPAQTINGIFYDIGNGGYSSGGDLAVALQQNTSALHGYYVTYLGISDATTALGGGAVELGYNGVRFSDTAVQEGLYTFWAFEQLCYRSNYGTVDANGKAVADMLANQIKTVDAVLAGELMTSMHVTRAVEGGVVTPTY